MWILFRHVSKTSSTVDHFGTAKIWSSIREWFVNNILFWWIYGIDLNNIVDLNCCMTGLVLVAYSHQPKKMYNVLIKGKHPINNQECLVTKFWICICHLLCRVSIWNITNPNIGLSINCFTNTQSWYWSLHETKKCWSYCILQKVD